MKADLEEETETPPTPDTEADDEMIVWHPGMCVTPDCGHPIPREATFCPPCEILFGSYAELLAHDDVQEWQPPVVQTEPVAQTPPEPAPTARKRTRTRKTPPPVPPIEGVQQSETS